jgi:hypothetical protein
VMVVIMMPDKRQTEMKRSEAEAKARGRQRGKTNSGECGNPQNSADLSHDPAPQEAPRATHLKSWNKHQRSWPSVVPPTFQGDVVHRSGNEKLISALGLKRGGSRDVHFTPESGHRGAFFLLAPSTCRPRSLGSISSELRCAKPSAPKPSRRWIKPILHRRKSKADAWTFEINLLTCCAYRLLS